MKWRKVGTLMSLLAIILFVSVQVLIWFHAGSQFGKQSDYLIILGSGLDETVPTRTLKNRLDIGIRYLKKYQESYVIVSGGQGKDEKISEAEAMSRYLIEKGISQSRIYKEEQSTSTYENIKFSKKIIEKHHPEGDYSIMIATSNFHLFRAKHFAKKLGLEYAGISASTPKSVLPIYSTREFFAILKAFMFHR